MTTIRPVSPAVTGRQLSPKEVDKLIKKNWTIPLGVSNLDNIIRPKKQNVFQKIISFIKNLF